ncbi:hypothetical protein PR202_ga23735 [Eleusine coracana subsp. coracana]|uniref:Uncharacterized protein n=1 Tax=Eleusine coracana subsp. coracana TaxID=191504 RepID=A0AAV5D6M3_ELECO|nr:hypothetical protein PR202_ga23735 [Eleusine coracana subsp. coracana]
MIIIFGALIAQEYILPNLHIGLISTDSLPLNPGDDCGSHGHLPNASSSSGWQYATAVGLQIN